MVIAQFWAFANDLYTQEQGKRLFPLIGVGSSLGAWVGSVRAGQLVEAFGPQRLLIGGAVILRSVRPARARRRPRHARERRATTRSRPTTKIAGRESGFSMIVSRPLPDADRRCSTCFLNVVNTSGEYLFGRYVVDTANATFGDGTPRRRPRASSSSARPTAACSAT